MESINSTFKETSIVNIDDFIPTRKNIKFIDLFAGIGGFRYSFDKLGCKCVFSSEINEACQRVYEMNFGDKPFGDITKVDVDIIPDFDILCAGFPCQPFSICGKKRGFEDTRGTLFFEICKIIQKKNPSVIFLENVKHLTHHDGGKTFSVIISSLENLGYNVAYKILNSKDFGVAQSRERIIIIATRKGVFDFGKLKKCNPVYIKDILDRDNYKDFEYLEKKEYTLIDKSLVQIQESGLIFVGYRNKSIWKKGVREHTEHLSRVHRQPNRIYSIEGVHPTIPSQETSGRFWIYDEKNDIVRKLTLNECYKLMGFPDNFKRDTNKSNAYKQIGNSVVIPMICEIAKSIIEQGFSNGKNGEFSEKRNNLGSDNQRVQEEFDFCS